MSTTRGINIFEAIHNNISFLPKFKLKEGEFVRVEDKFLLDDKDREFVMGQVSKHMEPAYLTSDINFTLIESLYFDGDDLNFFHHHFNAKGARRYKLRVRNYGPNGVWQKGPYLLELKSKKNCETKKFRFYISDKSLELLNEGHLIPLTDELFTLNHKVKPERLIKRILKVNKLIGEYHLTPRVRVRYRREAFERDNFRVTIDSDLEMKCVGDLSGKSSEELRACEFWGSIDRLLSKYNGEKRHILEIKHRGVIPDWMTNVLDHCELAKTGFSKYCFTVATSILEQ